VKLTATNRRRALQRRRKLMPEPRRIAPQTDTFQESELIDESPVLIHPDQRRADIRQIDSAPVDTVIAPN
jgi:hypothetical protein